MEQLRIELEDTGHPAEFTAINVAGKEAYEPDLVWRCSFPLFQDQAELDAVGHMGAQIRELLIYGRDGKLAVDLPWASADLTQPANYTSVKNAILGLE